MKKRFSVLAFFGGLVTGMAMTSLAFVIVTAPKKPISSNPVP